MYPIFYGSNAMPMKYKHLSGFLVLVVAGVTLFTNLDFTALGAETLVQRGQKLFKKCVHCHTYNEHQGHRIGPNLYGMFGRKAGAIADYDYSEAWKTADFIWTNKTLDTYLMAPHKMIPNNRMPFNGLSKAEDRHALIIYMKTIVVP